MKKIIFGFMLGLLTIATIVYAEVKQQENVSDTSQESLSILSEQLRQIRATLNDHEQRLVAGGH